MPTEPAPPFPWLANEDNPFLLYTSAGLIAIRAALWRYLFNEMISFTLVSMHPTIF